jgi:hypothetical protein
MSISKENSECKRPAALPVLFAHISPELRAPDQWVLWRLGPAAVHERETVEEFLRATRSGWVSKYRVSGLRIETAASEKERLP